SKKVRELENGLENEQGGVDKSLPADQSCAAFRIENVSMAPRGRQRSPRPRDFYKPTARAQPEDGREGLWTRDQLVKMHDAFASALSRETRSVTPSPKTRVPRYSMSHSPPDKRR